MQFEIPGTQPKLPSIKLSLMWQQDEVLLIGSRTDKDNPTEWIIAELGSTNGTIKINSSGATALGLRVVA